MYGHQKTYCSVVQTNGIPVCDELQGECTVKIKLQSIRGCLPSKEDKEEFLNEVRSCFDEACRWIENELDVRREVREMGERAKTAIKKLDGAICGLSNQPGSFTYVSLLQVVQQLYALDRYELVCAICELVCDSLKHSD